MRVIITGCAIMLALSAAAHAQTAMQKAGRMAHHCQQPVKTQSGAQVKNARGDIVTMDCPQQGRNGHPAVQPQNRREP